MLLLASTLLSSCSDDPAGSDSRGQNAAGSGGTSIGASGSTSVAGSSGQPGAGGSISGAGGIGAMPGGSGAGGFQAAGNGGGGSSGSAGAGGGSSDLCLDRVGGALVDVEIGPDALRLWLTDEGFITEAESLLEAGTSRIMSLDLVDGTDCDPQWSWHVDPATPEFVDAADDICDYWPSDIEEDKGYWLEAVTYCPKRAVVAGVMRQ